jgi:copper resistance protein B
MMGLVARTVAGIAAVVLLGGLPAAQAQEGASHVHGGKGGQQTAQPQPKATGQHEHSAHEEPAAQKQYPADLPPVTDADRAAAFPQLVEPGHAVHDNGTQYFVLFDQLEWQSADRLSGANWDTSGWIGRDVDRFWFRTEGDSENRTLGEAQAHALYGRAIHRWWDVVAGLRQDFGPGPARTWAAVGIQGLAPYWFEVQATAYVGQSGRTHFRFEAEYELLITNRLILQPQVELEVYGKSDPERRIGAGLSSLDTGLRLRYEFRREFAPYVGVTWNQRFFGTADLSKAAGEDPHVTRFVTGVRLWF